MSASDRGGEERSLSPMDVDNANQVSYKSSSSYSSIGAGGQMSSYPRNNSHDSLVNGVNSGNSNDAPETPMGKIGDQWKTHDSVPCDERRGCTNHPSNRIASSSLTNNSSYRDLHSSSTGLDVNTDLVYSRHSLQVNRNDDREYDSATSTGFHVASQEDDAATARFLASKAVDGSSTVLDTADLDRVVLDAASHASSLLIDLADTQAAAVSSLPSVKSKQRPLSLPQMDLFSENVIAQHAPPSFVKGVKDYVGSAGATPISQQTESETNFPSNTHHNSYQNRDVVPQSSSIISDEYESRKDDKYKISSLTDTAMFDKSRGLSELSQERGADRGSEDATCARASSPGSPTSADKKYRQIKFRENPTTNFEKALAAHTEEIIIQTAGDSAEDCSICLCGAHEESPYQSRAETVRDITGSVALKQCRHVFHASCLVQSLATDATSITCPNCKTIHGTLTGTQPSNGTMHVRLNEYSLPGYDGCKTYKITYSFPRGIQGPEHPSPGRPYFLIGFPRCAYLPDTPKGRKVLRLLQEAFDRRLIFTVGTSATTSQPDCVVWNGVHHKTEVTNYGGHGYPDPNYLDNVTMELAALGVTEDNCRNFDNDLATADDAFLSINSDSSSTIGAQTLNSVPNHSDIAAGDADSNNASRDDSTGAGDLMTRDRSSDHLQQRGICSCPVNHTCGYNHGSYSSSSANYGTNCDANTNYGNHSWGPQYNDGYSGCATHYDGYSCDPSNSWNDFGAPSNYGSYSGGHSTHAGHSGGYPNHGGHSGGVPNYSSYSGGHPNHGGHSGGHPNHGGHSGGVPNYSSYPVSSINHGSYSGGPQYHDNYSGAASTHDGFSGAPRNSASHSGRSTNWSTDSNANSPYGGRSSSNDANDNIRSPVRGKNSSRKQKNFALNSPGSPSPSPPVSKAPPGDQQHIFRDNPVSNAEKMLRDISFEVPVTPSQGEDTEKCSICLHRIHEVSPAQSPTSTSRGLVGAVMLANCGHCFHCCCLLPLLVTAAQSFSCPVCRTLHGAVTGTQPVGGRMSSKVENSSLPGFKKCKTIVINYHIPEGKQGREHPHPGRPYVLNGFPRVAYLPDNEQGRQVLSLLKIAFDRRLIFTVGHSASLNQPDCVIWGEISHKTFKKDNKFGYPDPKYLDNVMLELAAHGITLKY
ncbi:uncharacterized protein LOC108677886 isoform X3 [Hyalella azteca]|uniref:RING-type E3 ubiquitin transferase n=1 Tax=Hyalella azteca TaxID=294128 RepID=A0A979FJG0_HYAAZ|nr:uncharacterized protein LOC108677886 isoform X3 [Hyalella azteca]